MRAASVKKRKLSLVSLFGNKFVAFEAPANHLCAWCGKLKTNAMWNVRLDELPVAADMHDKCLDQLILYTNFPMVVLSFPDVPKDIWNIIAKFYLAIEND